RLLVLPLAGLTLALRLAGLALVLAAGLPLSLSLGRPFGLRVAGASRTALAFAGVSAKRRVAGRRPLRGAGALAEVDERKLRARLWQQRPHEEHADGQGA